MSKGTTTTESKTETASTSKKVMVRITKMGTHACGCVFAKGAEITLPLDKAKLLVELEQGEIIGTP